MATVFWDSEGIVLTDYLEHSRTITGTYYTNLIRKCREALKAKRGWTLQRVVPCHRQLIRHHKHWLPSELPVLNCFATHRIWQIWTPLTSICCKTEKNSWKDGKLLTTMMSFAPQMAGWRTIIKNSSTMAYGLWRIAGPSAFLSKGTMLKSDKISCSYSVLNYIRLRTFWTPLVYAIARICHANSVCLSIRPSVRHTRVLYQNGWKYHRNFFTVW